MRGLGFYEILEEIGCGMGVVFRAHDPKLQRIEAMKALAPEMARLPSARQRFLRQARAAAATSHPHVVTILAPFSKSSCRHFDYPRLQSDPNLQHLRIPVLIDKVERVGVQNPGESQTRKKCPSAIKAWQADRASDVLRSLRRMSASLQCRLAKQARGPSAIVEA